MDLDNNIDYEFEIINRRLNELSFLLGEIKNSFFLISYKLNKFNKLKLNKKNPEKKNIDINISNLIVTNKNLNINKTKKLNNKDLDINNDFDIKINRKKTRKKPRKRIVRSVFVIDTSDESNSD